MFTLFQAAETEENKTAERTGPRRTLLRNKNEFEKQVVEHVCLTNTKDAPRVRKMCANSDTIVGDCTPGLALALFVFAKLTMDQYNLLRDS
jgi:hypothetical protein